MNNDSVFDVAKGVSMRQIISRYSKKSIPNITTRGNIQCPFEWHNDTVGSFHIYENTNSFHCFGCAIGGSPIDFVMATLGFDPKDRANYKSNALCAAKDICDTFGLEYADNYVVKDTAYQNYVDVYKFVADLFVKCNNLDNALSYWKSRGLDSLVKEYGLGYCPAAFMDSNNTIIKFKDILRKQFPNIPEATLDSYELYDSYGQCVFAERYMFAIKNSKGDVVAFSGRTATNHPAKYYNSKETRYFQKRKVLYNLDKAKGYPFVYVVEGQCDALSLVVSGIPNVVASLGTAFTSEHLELLRGKEVILAFDNDDAGHSIMAKLIEDSNDKPDINLVVLNNFKDNYKDLNEALMSGLDLKDNLKDLLKDYEN